ncbi:NUDIX hydrolase [Fictibacillus sp. WQ 8-8]|uniref:NUDIX hydrolase n=1 Tax=unclassified Fictibacillus TaxID=2644029 RepID=UPI0006A78D8A|nr:MULTISPECIES: NUDIX hydrolase [unclassified Fictibacillus]MCQ6265174.1 NUDIX hydrolase [Fictibacillus sp. WQ 8-8]MED2971860.1 NUDIX hydrolase [Fictibacillus sp. B-59209]
MKRVDVVYVLLWDERADNILMVKNRGEKGSYYTLPGGAVEEGETLEQGAVREVREETGLEVEVENVFGISEAFFEESRHHVIFFTFLGKITGGKIGTLCPDEIEEVAWMDYMEAEPYLYLPDGVKERIKSNHSISYSQRGTVRS